MSRGTLFLAGHSPRQRMLRHMGDPHRIPRVGYDRIVAGEFDAYEAARRTAFPVGMALSPEAVKQLETDRLIREAGAIGIEQNVPLQARFQALPIPATLIPANSAVEIPVNVTFPFQVIRPFFPSSIAPNYVVDNLEVALQKQFLGAGGIGADAFSEVSLLELKGDTANIGQPILITVRNITLGDLTLRGAAIFGNTARP